MVVAEKEEILGQFFGNEDFPVTWESQTEKELFWVYDDLHCPHPLSPMYFDIGGWWLSCDHMFRRFGTPFATDWVAKNVNGYLYTAAIPADPNVKLQASEYDLAIQAVVPQDADYASKIGTFLGSVLPTYGNEFVDWWRDRLGPEMEKNFAYLEGKYEEVEAQDWNLARRAVLLEW